IRGGHVSGVQTCALPISEGSSVLQTTFLFGPNKNVVWKTELPPGYSSPILVGDRIFLTAIDNEKLFTICLDRASGRINWRREVPRPRKGELHTANGPASPSPTSDGKSVFVFYYDFGLVSYGPDGNERWR